MKDATQVALDKRKSGYRTGRAKEEFPPIPTYRNPEVGFIADWMNTHRENHRPLTVAAPLLTIVCALYDHGHHLPTRERLAAEIGCTKDGIDAAISTAIAYGEISERHVTVEGGVAKRRSTRRLRYLDPSPGLLEVWRKVAGKSLAVERTADLASALPASPPAAPARRSPWPGVLARVES